MRSGIVAIACDIHPINSMRVYATERTERWRKGKKKALVRTGSEAGGFSADLSILHREIRRFCVGDTHPVNCCLVLN